MATVIDALVVTLGLDPKNFTAGKDKAVKDSRQAKDDIKKINAEMTADERKEAQERGRIVAKETAEREESAKRIGGAISRVRNEALALLGIFTAGLGIKNFTESTILGAASLGRVSANLNMNAKDLATWQLAAKNAGGTAEGMTAQLKESASEVAKFRSGLTGESTQWFFRMGGTTADLRDGNTYLLARSKIVADIYKTDRARAALVAAQMGIGEDQFNLIKEGPEAIERARAAQAGLADELARAAGPAEALRRRWDTLGNRFQSVGVRIVTELMPVLEKLAGWFERIGDWAVAHKQDISNWVDQAVEAIREFVVMADKAAQAVGGWQNVLIALAGLKLLSIVTPLLSVASALTSIAASLGLIGGASGTAGVAAISGLGVAAGGAALALYSHNLNQGEDDQLQALNNPAPNQGKQVAAVKWFESRGYTREQAVGLVANLQAESNLNPSAVGDSGSAYGLGQWHADRQADFKKAFGIDIRQASVQQQLEFVDWELRNTERTAREKLMGASTPQAAADAVSRYYERPARADWDASRRAAAAGALYGAVYRSDLGDGTPVGMANAAQAPLPTAGGTTNTSSVTSETHINGPINVYSQATDAQGIARDMGGALQEHLIVPQANTGLR